jgi:hypothetical protein
MASTNQQKRDYNQAKSRPRGGAPMKKVIAWVLVVILVPLALNVIGNLITPTIPSVFHLAQHVIHFVHVSAFVLTSGVLETTAHLPSGVVSAMESLSSEIVWLLPNLLWRIIIVPLYLTASLAAWIWMWREDYSEREFVPRLLRYLYAMTTLQVYTAFALALVIVICRFVVPPVAHVLAYEAWYHPVRTFIAAIVSIPLFASGT